MMKKIFVTVVLISSFLFAQDENRNIPSVELPDFVITGKDALDIKKVKKPAPEFISTVSGEFFKPSISPEELELREFPNPLKQEKQLIDSVRYFNGYAEAGAGIHSLPVGKIIYTHPIERGRVFGKFGAVNRIAHVDNSQFQSVNGGLGFSYNVSNDAEVLPGTQFRLEGGYKVSDYKLYGAAIPSDKSLSDGKLSFRVDNRYLEKVIFGANITADFTSLNKENYRENLWSFGAYSRFDFSSFNLGFNFVYDRQYLKSDRIGNDELDFALIRPIFGLNISKSIKLSFGFTYVKSGKDAYSFPYASLGVKFDKRISLFGEYAPGAEFVTNTSLLRRNRFFDPQSFINILFEQERLFRITMKYEYDKYFEIDGGFEYMSSDNVPVFHDSFNRGSFGARISDAVSYTGFIHLLFHLGPAGVFYGTVEGNDTKNGSDKFLPYYPQIKSSLNYGFTFNFGLSANALMTYQSKVFTDIQNNNSLSSYIDLGIKLAYPITTGFNLTFELANLLSRNNYFWNAYKELPLDATLGVNFKW